MAWFVFEERKIRIGAGAKTGVGIELEVEFVARAVEIGALRNGVGDAAGIAEAVENGVRAAREADTLGVVDVGRRGGREEIALGARDGESARRVGYAREQAAVAGGSAELRIVGAGVGDELEDLVERGEAKVAHEVGGDDRLGDAGVLDARLEARARECLGGGIAGVFGGGDFERGEENGFLLGRSGRRGRGDLGEQRETAGRGQQAAQDEGRCGFIHGVGGFTVGGKYSRYQTRSSLLCLSEGRPAGWS